MDIDLIKKNLNVKFNNDELLEIAFTHSSYANTHHLKSNERLEFLGDSILNFVTTDFLFNNFDDEEGVLSKLKAYLVSAENLSKIVKNLDIIKQLKCGTFNPKQSKNVMCDLFESIVGAIYLDSGFNSAKKFIYEKLNFTKESIAEQFENIKDYKTKLQEIVQKNGKNTIKYVLIKKTGKDDNPMFTVSLTVDEKVLATCSAKTKKEAESMCAKKGCEILEN